MSLQVCHCGWAKVTTYHGLRTHQGKMGCTLKSAKVAESEQQYTCSNVGFTYTQRDIRMDVYTSVKTDFNAEIKLQVCHCGWAKMTTYQGLRIHQGKMGCTPKGMKMLKREKYDRKYQWEVEETQIKHQITKRTIKKENLPEVTSIKDYYSSARTTATIKEEYKSSFTSSERSSQKPRNSKVSRELQDFATLSQVNTSVRENPTPAYLEAVVRPKGKRMNRPTLSQISDDEGMIEDLYTDSDTDYATVAAKIKAEPKSPPVLLQYPSHRATISKPIHQQQGFTDVQVNKLVRKAPPPVRVRQDQMLSQNVPVSPRISSAKAATIKEEPKPSFPISQQPFQRARVKQDFTTGVQLNGLTRQHLPVSPLATVQPKEKQKKNQPLSQVKQQRLKLELQKEMSMRNSRPTYENIQDSTSTNTHMHCAAAKEDPKSSAENEITEPDFSTGLTVKELAQMFSATTVQATAVRPKKKHREEPKVVKPEVQTFPASTAQKTAAQALEKDREDQQISTAPDTKSGPFQRNPSVTKATVTEDPKSSGESAQLSDYASGMKVKELAQIFSATARKETVVQEKEKHREEPKLLQEKRDRVTDDLKHKIQMKEQKMALCQSYRDICKKTVQPNQSSLDALWPQVDSVFSEVIKVVEDAKQKTHDLPLSTLRTTTLTMMEQIHQKLDKMSSVELKWISKFSVDIKLDPTTAHRRSVSTDGVRVIDGGANKASSGSILELNSSPTGKSYWEVEVSNKTGWDLGVARGNANNKGKLTLNPNNGFWVIAHYENKEYVALTAPPVGLSLKEKPEKVGVFVNYKEGFVSFYDVTAQSHIYSFTECSFTGKIFPYFSVHHTDPLIISTVKQQ